MVSLAAAMWPSDPTGALAPPSRRLPKRIEQTRGRLLSRKRTVGLQSDMKSMAILLPLSRCLIDGRSASHVVTVAGTIIDIFIWRLRLRGGRKSSQLRKLLWMES